VVAFEKHLLSMKDNNQSANLRALVDAGVRSFKIEGRYKDMGYVKNITAYYRQRLDDILEDRPDLARASSGRTAHFLPDPDKTFHRGSTDYFVSDRKIDIGAFDSPTFTGLPVGVVERSASATCRWSPTSRCPTATASMCWSSAKWWVPRQHRRAQGRVRRRRREALPLPRRAERDARRPVQAAPQPPAQPQPRPQLAAGAAEDLAERRIGLSWVARLREERLS
jgi:putative protease